VNTQEATNKLVQEYEFSLNSAEWLIANVNRHGGQVSVWVGNKVAAKLRKTPRKYEYAFLAA
jgi:hypothetical protein